jgi:hypothetical protein
MNAILTNQESTYRITAAELMTLLGISDDEIVVDINLTCIAAYSEIHKVPQEVIISTQRKLQRGQS